MLRVVSKAIDGKTGVVVQIRYQRYSLPVLGVI